MGATPREGRDCDIVAALLGPPNSGKTSLFNALTGRSEKVANWPGVTVDVRMAVVRVDSRRVCIVDLPGTYSISGTGPEEAVTRKFILEESPDVLVVLVDATNPAPGLHLAVEALETGRPVVVALTKTDAVRGRVDAEGLARELGAPVVATSALRSKGIRELLEAVVEVAGRRRRPLRVNYGRLEPLVERLEAMLARCAGDEARWLAVRLLEGLGWAEELAERLCGPGPVEEARRVRETLGFNAEAEALAARYSLVTSLVQRYWGAAAAGEAKPLSRLDELLLNPATGVPISLAILAAAFLLVFTLSTGFPLNILLDLAGLHEAAAFLEEHSLAGILGALFDQLAGVVEEHVGGWLGALLGQAVIGGVGLVLSFIPLIVLVYAVFGALEDSGLAARMALAYHPLMRRLGVSGKAIFPAIMSLGCNVPAVMGTRILDTRVEKEAVAIAVPFIPCQARLVVLLAFIAAFFRNPLAATGVALLVYGAAFLVFLATLRLYTAIRGGGGDEELVLEIPPLKRPSLRVVWWHVREAAIHFLVRAGTLILVFSVVAWLASTLTPGLAPATHPDESIAAALGKALAPLAELAFGVAEWKAWRLAFAFIEGLAAKEVFLDALAMVAPPGVEVETPAQAVAYLHLTPSQAIAVLLAVTLYMPCLATLATIHSELRSAKLTAASLAYSIAVAIIVSTLARLILAPIIG